MSGLDTETTLLVTLVWINMDLGEQVTDYSQNLDTTDIYTFKPSLETIVNLMDTEDDV